MITNLLLEKLLNAIDAWTDNIIKRKRNLLSEDITNLQKVCKSLKDLNDVYSTLNVNLQDLDDIRPKYFVNLQDVDKILDVHDLDSIVAQIKDKIKSIRENV